MTDSYCIVRKVIVKPHHRVRACVSLLVRYVRPSGRVLAAAGHLISPHRPPTAAKILLLYSTVLAS